MPGVRLGVDLDGFDADFTNALRIGGYTRDAHFGGGGDSLLAELPGYAIYATLVPEDTDALFNFAAGELALSVRLPGAGDAVYLRAFTAVPLPAAAYLFLSAVSILGGCSRRRVGAKSA